MNPLDWLSNFPESEAICSAHNTYYGPVLNSRAPVKGGETEERVIVFSVGQYSFLVNICCTFLQRKFPLCYVGWWRRPNTFEWCDPLKARAFLQVWTWGRLSCAIFENSSPSDICWIGAVLNNVLGTRMTSANKATSVFSQTYPFGTGRQ